jgi:hypothetical protein
VIIFIKKLNLPFSSEKHDLEKEEKPLRQDV